MKQEYDNYSYEVIDGLIDNGEVQAKQIRLKKDDESIVLTFDEPVPTDEVESHIITNILNKLSDEREDIDFSYTEPQRFRGQSNVSDALVKMFHICPCTTKQFDDYFGGEYGSSYPSKLRDKGLVTSIGKVGSKRIWVLTPEGMKEALCLIGHPEEPEDLIEIRDPTEKEGLNRLFDEGTLSDEE